MIIKKKLIISISFLIFGYSYSQTEKLNNEEKKIYNTIRYSREIGNIDSEKALKLLLKSNNEATTIGYKRGELDSYNSLMIIYYWKGNYKKVIEFSDKTGELAKEFDDYELLADTYRLKGLSYLELGFNNNALLELHKALKYAKKIGLKDAQHFQISTIYDNIGGYHENIGVHKDSLLFYKQKSLVEVEKISNTPKVINQKYQMIAFQQMNLGMISSEEGKIQEAEQHFFKSFEIYQNREKYPLLPKNDEIILLSEMGRFYLSQKKYEKAITYAQDAKELEKSYSTPYIRKDILETLFKSYLELNDLNSSKTFSKAYSVLNDSIKNSEKKSIDTPVKQILNEQQEKQDHRLFYLFLLSSLIIITTITLGIIFWKRKKSKLHHSYKMIIKALKDQTTSDDSQRVGVETRAAHVMPENIINIAENTIASLLNKLAKFEKSEKFLKTEVSLTTLSNSLNTNPRYLSEIIKQHKSKSFNNYLNGLRIQYITNKLYEKSIYREYKISHLAEISGFSSREVFAVVFKKETGVTPSYFINQLKKDDINTKVH